MTGPVNPTDDFDPIDDLVREHVEREVDSVDPAAMLDRVRAARGAAPRRRSWTMLASGLIAGVGIGVAASVVVLVQVDSPSAGSRLSEAHAASPTDLVKSMFVAHSDNTDRLYDVKVELGDTVQIARKYPFLPPPAHFVLINDSKLWVRGNQFWIEPGAGTRPMCWGRDRDGRLWFVLDLRTGLQYAREEDDDKVIRLCNLMSLRVPKLAAEMLDGYELSSGDKSGLDAPMRVVGSIRNNPHDVAVSHVTLELDPRTKVIRKAIQRRTIGNDLIGTFTYTLVETGHIPDSRYDLLGHLEPGGRILDARDKKGRNDMFIRCPAWKK